MAPVQKKRASVRAKNARSTRPQITLPLPDDVLFPPSKRDKRSMKHSTFVHKIEKSSSKPKKRRRPSKKLVANLGTLVDALPELDGGGENSEVIDGQAKIQRKSLRNHPGAMKRREKLEKMERDRFNRNLAQMVGNSPSIGGSHDIGSFSDRWTALKNHVQSTAEKKAEFYDT